MKEINIYEKVREYMGMTQEEIARKLNISVRTWNRWENEEIEPSSENLEKIINLVKKQANKEFRIEFLKQVIYNAPILTFGRKEKDIIRDVMKNWNKLRNSPVMKKIFQENPEYKSLSFDEIFKRYTKNKISFNGCFILNLLPIPSSFDKKYPKIKKIRKVKNTNRIMKNKVKKSPKEKNIHKHKNSDKKDENDCEEGDDDSDEWKEENKKLWENYYKRPLTNEEIEEIRFNLCNFFKLLIKWYNKNLKKGE